MSEINATRIYTPMDARGRRCPIDLVTSADCVQYDENTTVEDKIKEIEGLIHFGNDQPTKKSLWIESLGKAATLEEALNKKILDTGIKQFYQEEVPGEAGVWLQPLSSTVTEDHLPDMKVDYERIVELGLENEVAEGKPLYLAVLSSTSV